MRKPKRSVWIIEMLDGEKHWMPSIDYGYEAFKTKERCQEKVDQIVKRQGDAVKYRATRYAASEK